MSPRRKIGVLMVTGAAILGATLPAPAPAWADSWRQVAELQGSDTVANDGFGFTIAALPSTIVVGADGHANDAGRVYVFTKSPHGWHQTAELVGSDTVAGDLFGSSLAAAPGMVVVSGHNHAKDAGRVYVFTESAHGWHQSAELVGSDTVSGDYFGTSLAAAPDVIVVGAIGHAKDAGRVYVFTKSARGWHQTAELVGSDTAANNGFGTSVGSSPGTIVVGADGPAKDTGRVYVFTESAHGWHQTAELVGSDTVAGDYFGASFATAPDVIVVGAIGHAKYAGRVYVFTKSAHGWHQTTELVASDTVAGDFFGASFAASSATIIVGADGHANDAGRVYVFTRSTHGWHQTAELVGSDTVTGDAFGLPVAASPGMIVVGADGHAGHAGLVYVFQP